MDIQKTREALQDLIIRLQDAEKGYKEIEKAVSNVPFKNWLNQYATERHNMHRALEQHVKELGGDAEVKTSFLGALHRMFIDLKINNTNADKEFPAVVEEIERGASTLIDDYSKVLSDVELPSNVITTLLSQKATVEVELKELLNLKEQLESIEA